MKKFVKMSLAAAVAVASLSTTASAKDFAEAIKGVDVSGSLGYRYDDRSTKTDGVAKSVQDNKDNTYKAIVKIKSPVNDALTANVTAFTRAVTGGAGAAVANKDANPNLMLTHANFAYTVVQNLTVVAGKQAVATPWTNGGDAFGSAQSGTGVLALYNAGVATLAGAYFVNNSIDATIDDTVNVSDNDIAVVAVIAPVGPANLQVWYADGGDSDTATNTGTVNLTNGFDALYASVSGKIGPVSLSVEHATLEGDNNGLKKQKLTQATASMSVGAIGLSAEYATTGKDGGTVAFDNDADSTIYLGWATNMNSKQDADGFSVSANTNVTPTVNLSATFANIDEKKAAGSADDVETDEWVVQATYAMSKNFTAYVRYANVETDNTTGADTEQDRGRLELLYKF